MTGVAEPRFPIATLEGPTIVVRPLCPDDHEPLYTAAADPAIWALHPEPTRWQRTVFDQGFWPSALACGTAMVVIAKDAGAIIGASRYYDHRPADRYICIGYTFLVRAHWGTATNAELKRLMLEHAFRYVDTVEFHIGVGNLRSRRAVEKLGARLDREEPFVVHGVTSPHAIYRIEASATKLSGRIDR
ncbi:MAG: hypothetical protein RL625_249 [Gemmatimonadota bacterium]